LFETAPSPATRAGILACVGTGLVGVICLVFAALLPTTFATLLLLVTAVSAFAALSWLLWQLRGLGDISYSLDRNSFVIRHGNAREIIPMSDVQRLITEFEQLGLLVDGQA